MPIYTYKCSKCDEVFDKIEKMDSEPLMFHENCGGSVERVPTAASFKLIGRGFYKNEYSNKNQTGGACY